MHPGHSLTNLPGKEEKQVDITLSPHELQEYKLLEKQMQDLYVPLARDGVGKHTIKIMALIKQLQRACSGLVHNEEFEYDEDAVTNIIDSATKSAPSEDSQELHCSKLHWLMDKLKDIRDNRPEAKVLIFSQFTSTFARIVAPLTKSGYQFRTLTSDMTMIQRKKALRDFRDDPPTTIFLLSMRSGAVGLNLTQANHVIIMDPCVNKQLELQAVGRVHRLGQRREVKIYRLACKDTIEERILQMHTSGEVVSDSSESAGSLRDDRISLPEARYRNLLGIVQMPPGSEVDAVGVKQEEEGDDDYCEGDGDVLHEEQVDVDEAEGRVYHPVIIIKEEPVGAVFVGSVTSDAAVEEVMF
mmetsp:Transcript_20973/g.28853  ORF Transcript_20973/g.28853 Transcript_20973/m.28853 type:complete len:356 (-) Transcript_20973:366-1433(-)